MPAPLAIGIVAGLLLAAPHASAAQTLPDPPPAAIPKLRFYDSYRILNEVEEGKAAVQKLERDERAETESINKRGEALRKKAEAFDKQGAMMKPEAKQARQKALQKEYDELQQAAMEAREKVVKDRQEATERIDRKVRAVIGKLADQHGFTSVLDINQGVAYHRPADDITDDVIAAYNRQFGSK